ncbi:hypothetical protein [Aquimarina rubra]|uniref:DUF4468 domain-containing protein n=1 Tax=Aquimarina rubra TaxID=1920033 RepID=A0ABW5LJH1_9FLAO
MNITRILFLGLAFLFVTNISAQNSVNDYKYIIVPEGYVFLRENDDYQLNSLTKFLFNKYGFRAFIQGEKLPEDLKINGCKGLRADVKKNSGLLKTKLVVNLVDCNGTTIFSSREGTSREKEFKKSYHEALRNAFKDIQALNYKYNGKNEGIVKKEAEAIPDPVYTTPSVTTKDAPVSNNANNEKQIVNKASEKKTISFLFKEEVYFFESKPYGFELKQKKEVTSVSIGKVFKSSRKNNYIIQAGDLSGSGYFDSYGNFILDRVNPATDKLITDTFARQ